MRPAHIAIGGVVLVLGAALWSSVVTIDSGQQGVVERFGRASRDLLPGLHLKLPWPVEAVRKTGGAQSSLQMPIGYRFVDEQAGIGPTGRMKHWLTGDSNIVELRANLLYRVTDVRAWLYGVSGVRDGAEGGFEGRAFALRRLAEAALTSLSSEMLVDELLTGGTIVLANDAKKMIQEGADRIGLGVEINELQIVKSDPLATVDQAFRAVTDARTNAEKSKQAALSAKASVISRANIQRRLRIQEAEAEAQSLKSRALGRAEAFAALASDITSVDSLAAWKLRADGIKKILRSTRIETVAPGPDGRPAPYYLTEK